MCGRSSEKRGSSKTCMGRGLSMRPDHASDNRRGRTSPSSSPPRVLLIRHGSFSSPDCAKYVPSARICSEITIDHLLSTTAACGIGDGMDSIGRGTKLPKADVIASSVSSGAQSSPSRKIRTQTAVQSPRDIVQRLADPAWCFTRWVSSATMRRGWRDDFAACARPAIADTRPARFVQDILLKMPTERGISRGAGSLIWNEAWRRAGSVHG